MCRYGAGASWTSSTALPRGSQAYGKATLQQSKQHPLMSLQCIVPCTTSMSWPRNTSNFTGCYQIVHQSHHLASCPARHACQAPQSNWKACLQGFARYALDSVHIQVTFELSSEWSTCVFKTCASNSPKLIKLIKRHALVQLLLRFDIVINNLIQSSSCQHAAPWHRHVNHVRSLNFALI